MPSLSPGRQASVPFLIKTGPADPGRGINDPHGRRSHGAIAGLPSPRQSEQWGTGFPPGATRPGSLCGTDDGIGDSGLK